MSGRLVDVRGRARAPRGSRPPSRTRPGAARADCVWTASSRRQLVERARAPRTAPSRATRRSPRRVSTAAWASSSSATTAESCVVRTPSCAFDVLRSPPAARAMRASTAAFARPGRPLPAEPAATSASGQPGEGERSPSHRSSFAHRAGRPSPESGVRAPERRPLHRLGAAGRPALGSPRPRPSRCGGRTRAP